MDTVSAAAEAARKELEAANASWAKQADEVTATNDTLQAKDADIFGELGTVEEKAKEQAKEQKKIEAKMEELAAEKANVTSDPNSTEAEVEAVSKALAGADTDLRMLKVEIDTTKAKETKIVEKLAVVRKAIKENDRAGFKAGLARKDVDSAEDDYDRAEAKIAGANEA